MAAMRSQNLGGWAQLLFAVSGITNDRDRFEMLIEVDSDDTPLCVVALRARQGVSYPFVLDERVYWRVHAESWKHLAVMVHGCDLND